MAKVELSTAGLIEGGYTTATFGFQGWFTPTSTPPLGTVMPPAKIGNGNYIYTYSLGSVNYFGLSAVLIVGGCGQNSTVGITVAQAYNIDKKMDDGLPMSGYVKAIYNGGTKCNGPTNTASYAMGGSADGYGYYPDGASTPWADCQPVTTATPGTALTCYDNGNLNGAAQQYSTEISNGSGVNCALSFQMQGAAR